MPAVDQAAQLLFSLSTAPRGQATLTELCTQVGIHKSKGLAILNTLKASGLVARRDATKAYRLGPSLLSLSRALLDQADLTEATAPYLEPLAAATDSTVFLGLISRDEVVVAARHEAAAGGIGLNIRLGHRYPLTWGANGKAIVAFMPPEQQDRVLSGERLYFYSKANARPTTRVRVEIAECRRLGYSTDESGVQTGINAVSAPVLSTRGEPIGVVTVVGTFSADSFPEYGGRVAAVTREMSLDLGALLEGAA